MQVRGVELQNFRRYEHFLLHIPAGGLAFVGPNASGKTTLLEALYKVALLRGFGREEDMLRWGCSAYRLRARLEEGMVEVTYEKNQGTRVSWEGETVSPLARWIGRLPVVMLRPSDTDWIEGGAGGRRRWVDRLLCQAFPDYLAALSDYQRALAQRNALLAQPEYSLEQLSAWEKLLMQHGTLIQRRRMELVQELQPLLTQFYSQLASEPVSLSYKLTAEPDSAEWLRAWERLRSQEKRRGYTLLGPHAEDFLLSIEGKPARHYASEGQKKSLLIALKWAEMAYLRTHRSAAPLLLLDDIGEKLDSHRLAAVGQLSRLAGQTFLTDVEERRIREAFPELPVYRMGSSG